MVFLVFADITKGTRTKIFWICIDCGRRQCQEHPRLHIFLLKLKEGYLSCAGLLECIDIIYYSIKLFSVCKICYHL